MREFLLSTYRSHLLGDLRQSDVGLEVTVSGWIARKRDHGGVIFLDLRDHYGVTQVVFSNLVSESDKDLVNRIRLESVITVKGIVRGRSPETINSKLPTGEIEIEAKSIKIISEAQVLPFQIADDDGAPESQRLTYRFLELRREKLHKHIMLRGEVVKVIRESMHQLGFHEFHTPILTSSSPEGARDFIVPSRLHPGKFYALPQAPQQFKQLLMVSGFDRYFQIAPCFRDEDSRADRSPGEFYQLDMEFSFVEQEDVLRTNEALFRKVIPHFSSREFPSGPFKRIPHAEALARYGTDKPDLRYPLVIEDVSAQFEQSSFQVFRDAIADKGGVWAIACPLSGTPPSRKYLDDMVGNFLATYGRGLIYLLLDNEGYKGTLSKFVGAGEVDALRAKLSLSGTALVCFSAGPAGEVLSALGKLRVKLGKELLPPHKNPWSICWITDFPFYERDSESGALQFAHNPFSMPQGGMEALLSSDPLKIRALQYDLVLDGYELGSGGIRNHDPEIMYKAFQLTGYGREVVEEKFGGMLKAFRFGAPPHGGVAFGIERIAMLLADEQAIREVIAFPLAQNGEDLLMGAPSTLSEKQLREAHIELRPSAKKTLGVS